MGQDDTQTADEELVTSTEVSPKLSASSDELLSRVKEIAKRSRNKKTAHDVANTKEQGRAIQPVAKQARAKPSAIEEAQLSLFSAEAAGRFNSFPVFPSSEHPTFLTRIPIFVPSRRTNQRDLLDQDNSMAFETSWGAGKKHGPPLTVYDEDTLMAIGRLRSKCLAGYPHNMPVPVSALHRAKNNEEEIHVHIVHCMLSDLQEECCTRQGGKNNKLRLDSVKRLAATTIELDTKTANKVIGRGTTIKLIDVAWQEYLDNAILYIQFSPVMAAWYEREYTYINWEVRRKLHDTGKAIHRFLAGQPKTYEIRTQLLMKTIQYMRAYKYFMEDLKTTMITLQEEGWISEWEIVGTGRRVPHKLIIKRS